MTHRELPGRILFTSTIRRQQPTPADGDRTTILGGVHGAGAVKRQHVRRVQNRHPTVRLGVYALSF